MLEYRYNDINNRIHEVFSFLGIPNYTVTGLEGCFFYAENDEEPDMFLHHLKVIVYEVQHNILTDRMKADFIQYAERWDKGEFQPDIIPGDIPLIQADIDFVRAALKK